MHTHFARTKPIGRSKAPRFLIMAGLILISILFIQQAVAQDNRPTLKAPFHLHRNNAAAPDFDVSPLPLDAPIVLSQTFDSSYTPTTTLSATGWHQVTGTDATIGYTWGRVTSGPHADTVWVAATSLNGEPALTPGTDPYTNGMESLLIYGPLDLSDYSDAVITATYLLDSQLGDDVGIAISTNGTDFVSLSADSSSDPALAVTHNKAYSLKTYAHQGNIWLAFYFQSNDDDNVGLGAFLSNMAVRAVPLQKYYLPLIAKLPTPTPTVAPYLYSYTFGTGLNTDPDFVVWGGKYTASCGDNCTRYQQDIATSGNPDGAMKLYLTPLNDITAASPNVTAPTNFEYSADIYVVKGKKNARYGLMFDTSLSAFGRNGDGDPTFDPNRNLYKFDLQFNESDSTIVSYYRLQSCETDISACANVFEKTTVPADVVKGSGNWNTITVRRLNGYITVLVNGTTLINNLYDTSHDGSLEFGVFIQSKDFNDAVNPLKIYFDNIVVKQL